MDNVGVLVVALTNQQYIAVAQKQQGPVAFASLQIVTDMSATDADTTARYIGSLGYPYQRLNLRALHRINITEDGLASMLVIQPPNVKHVAMIIKTACREGFFIKGESEQSNINNYQW